MKHGFKDSFEKMATPSFEWPEIEWWFVCTCFISRIVDYMASDEDTYDMTNQDFLEHYAKMHKLVFEEDFMDILENEWIEYQLEGLLEPCWR